LYHLAHTGTSKTSGAFMAETPLTITVPEAGRKYFGLSRNASYAAAARGDIPTLKIGKLLRVPVRALDEMLDQPKTAQAENASRAENIGKLIEPGRA
jgi:hypothetical protein